MKINMEDLTNFKPLTPEEVKKILGLTIKHDEENKLITFLCLLSAYTDDSQFNISFNAPSSSGKSYIPTEIGQLFPKEDIMEVGYCSPTAFFHDKAEKYDKEKNELVINLSKKIIIFLDQPHTLLLEHLRPLLSHDKREIRIKITDKQQKAGLRTKNVLLIGFPSVVFCTAGLRVDEQESTRFIILSPEITQEKITSGILEKIKKFTNQEEYHLSLEVNEERESLKRRILAIKEADISDVIITNPDRIKEEFFKRTKILKPRHQRDIGRLISLIKAFALLNFWFRERKESQIIAQDEDIDNAFSLWDKISESQELNIPPYIYNLYKEIILKAFKEKNDGISSGVTGLTKKEILEYHYQVYGRVLSDFQLRKEIIPALEIAGLIFQEPDLNDKRKMLIYPTTHSTNFNPQKNSGIDGGVESNIFNEDKKMNENVDPEEIPF
jgi:DNA-binding MarR family transcriptional regulator